MVLSNQCWGQADAECVVCVHGVAQRGSIFSQLGKRLAAAGYFVAAVDLRGHGDSGRLPPWDTDAHVGDLLDTLEQLGVERATWVGHSFGGRLVAATAAKEPELTRRLVLLDPAYEVPAEAALRSAEIERLDWSFATRDGAVNALLSGNQMASRPEQVATDYAAADLRKGPDGRLRFSFSPSAVVVAWSEMVLPAPPLAQLPTLVVRPAVPLFDPAAREARYRDALGGLLSTETVPNGHNVLWEAPEETISAIEGFLGRAA